MYGDLCLVVTFANQVRGMIIYFACTYCAVYLPFSRRPLSLCHYTASIKGVVVDPEA
jgi:hypothetical protein